jgi:hypothetical protein
MAPDAAGSVLGHKRGLRDQILLPDIRDENPSLRTSFGEQSLLHPHQKVNIL